MVRNIASVTCAALLAIAAAPALAAPAPSLEIASQGYIFAGGHYVDGPDGKYMSGQAYVEYQIPKTRTHPYPIVMIEGGGQSGSNFTGTPDGREGWAQYFLKRGYAVYVVDQPGRGRSALRTDYGGTVQRPTSWIQQQSPAGAFETLAGEPHTQWPGTGSRRPSSTSSMPSNCRRSRISQAAGLNRDAGARSWTGSVGHPADAFAVRRLRLADCRCTSNLVKAIVAVSLRSPGA
jgi:hypothetical protein